MGPTINGPGNQAGATFSFDGRTLYFNAALNSRPGFGRYDLFVTTRSRAPESGFETIARLLPGMTTRRFNTVTGLFPPPGARRAVCPNYFGCACEIGNVFRGFLRHAAVRKTVASSQCEMSISEVLISVTLSVRGEVAERLKAAVC